MLATVKPKEGFEILDDTADAPRAGMFSRSVAAMNRVSTGLSRLPVQATGRPLRVRSPAARDRLKRLLPAVVEIMNADDADLNTGLVPIDFKSGFDPVDDAFDKPSDLVKPPNPQKSSKALEERLSRAKAEFEAFEEQVLLPEASNVESVKFAPGDVISRLTASNGKEIQAVIAEDGQGVFVRITESV